MTEINLLPNELRERDQREINSARKKPKLVNIELTNPKFEKITQPLKEPARQSVLSRLFAKKIDPAKPAVKKSEAEKDLNKAFRLSEKNLHIPKLPAEKEKVRVDLFADALAEQDEEKSSFKSSAQKEDRLTQAEPVDENVKIELMKLKEQKKSFGLFGFGKKDKSDKKKFENSKSDKKNKAKDFKREKGSNLDVNLIPQELSKRPELELNKKLFKSGALVFVVILLLVGGYLGITWYQVKITQDIDSLEAKIEVLSQEINQYEKDKDVALAAQKKLAAVRQLLNDHTYWTKFFSLLEKYTINEVSYVNFSMAGKDKLVISASGKDYQSVAKQLVAFKQAKEFIKNVKIDAASAEIDAQTGSYTGVNFNIDLEFMPNVFLKPIE
ncbi:MAG: hypothetical protein WCW26_05060 [Candidatus Buchananbacteria bacterium]